MPLVLSSTPLVVLCTLFDQETTGFLKCILFGVQLWLCSSKLGSPALPKILLAIEIFSYIPFVSKVASVYFCCWHLRALVSTVYSDKQ